MDGTDLSLRAYGDGRADGVAGRTDHERTGDPDYRAGLVDGELEAFEVELVAAIRKAMDGR